MKLAQMMRPTLATVAALLLAQPALAQDWRQVTGAQALRDFVSGSTLSWQEGRSSNWGEYRADGTGTLHAWGAEFDRTWEVKGEDQLCFYGEPASQCYRLEKSTTDPSVFRVTDAATGETTEVRAGAEGALVLDAAAAAGVTEEGGAATASASELANKLTNPANPILLIGNNFDYTAFDGDRPGASDQSQFKYFFQTIFPFKLANGNAILFRPGVPLVFDQGVPNASGGYDDVGFNLGDIGYDLIYNGTTKKGTIWGVGMVGTLPTATDDRLGQKLWGLGPEVLFGKSGKWGSAGAVLAQEWNVGGSGSGKINRTTLNYFYGISLKDGWALSAAPVVVYDHEAASSSQALTVPLAIGVAKTVVIAARPMQLKLEYWYNVVRPDEFAAAHTVRIGIYPIFSAPWNEGK